MSRSAARLTPILLLPPLLLGGCGYDPPSPVMQNDRMAARLAPELESGKVSVVKLPDGTQVVIPDETLFAPGASQITPGGQRILTYVVQALLEPTILSVGVSDPSDGLEGARGANVAQFIREHAPGAQVTAAGTPPVGTAPAPMQAIPVGATGTPVQGTNITVNILRG